ncbi:hypothetical protein FRC03_012847 [Tulasnella sp. 419]|nr:hypothetical protein FRC03_012847 [Tulasnella sp. 419]
MVQEVSLFPPRYYQAAEINYGPSTPTPSLYYFYYFHTFVFFSFQSQSHQFAPTPLNGLMNGCTERHLALGSQGG